MDRFLLTRRVAILGISANFLLLAAKLIAGIMNRSQAMIADGFNSAGDIFASAMTFVGNHISSRPEDEDHPYGHGKAEYVFSMIISFSLILVSFIIFRSSMNSIINREEFSFSGWLVAIALITILIKSTLFFYTRDQGKKTENLLVLANSEDHRNDIFVSTSTLLGVFFGKTYFWMDGVVGIGISIWIALTGARIFSRSYQVLMDKNIDKDMQKNLFKIIEGIEGVDHIDSILAKPVGVSYILVVKVSIDGSISVKEGHSVAAKIKERLKEERMLQDIIVHINPA